jgi:hypothetical protein
VASLCRYLCRFLSPSYPPPSAAPFSSPPSPPPSPLSLSLSPLSFFLFSYSRLGVMPPFLSLWSLGG